MLYEAAAWREGERPAAATVLARPDVARYLAGWPRTGDDGVVATTETGERLGAAWFRCFDEHERGYGFVDATIPELTIAVEEHARRGGVGRALLFALAEVACEHGFDAISLSVEEDNRAIALYEGVGFERVERVAKTWTMMLPLGPSE